MNTKSTEQENAKTQPLAEKESSKKWGKSVMNIGFSTIPSLIFRGQRRLGLSAVQLALLLHMIDFWWKQAQMPFPSKSVLAERMGLSARQIQRYLTELEKAGFIARKSRFSGSNGQQSNEYDLSGLVQKLKRLEPDFRNAKEQAEEVKVAAARRGGLAASTLTKK